MTALLLIRHGESTWNAAGRWQGQADPPLSSRGEQQARSAIARLGELAAFDIVVTSHLQRARRTGEILARGASIELGSPIADLAERSAGGWEGLTRDEIEARDSGFLLSGRRPDGYEGDAAVVERATRALNNLATRYPRGCGFVVTHGGVINALERAAIDGDPTMERIANLEGRWFDIDVDADGVRLVGERIQLLEAVDDAQQAGSQDRVAGGSGRSCVTG